jgi:hypothetical protein
LSEIDHQMIEEFKIKRMKSITRYGRTRKPASVNRELAILSGIFRMVVDYEEITDNRSKTVMRNLFLRILIAERGTRMLRSPFPQRVGKRALPTSHFMTYATRSVLV